MRAEDLKPILHKIPKVELHCHLGGAVHPSTFAELAAKHSIDVPAFEDPTDLYDYGTDFQHFLDTHTRICQSIRDRDDFRRVTYETLQEAAETGVRYREMFWSPTDHLDAGIPFDKVIDGIIDGIRDAETDFGIICRLIAGLNRQDTPERGVETVQHVIENPREESIGIGLEYSEVGNPPEKFWKAYRLAEEAGLHRTAHAGEAGSHPRNIEACLDLLGCERIDHGYAVLEDDRLVQRCKDEEVVFTVCPTAYRWALVAENGHINWQNHPIKEMAARGLKIMLNTDDPGLHQTDPADAYYRAAEHFGFGPDKLKECVLNGIDAAWIDETTKAQWRDEWSQEIDDLIGELG